MPLDEWQTKAWIHSVRADRSEEQRPNKAVKGLMSTPQKDRARSNEPRITKPPTDSKPWQRRASSPLSWLRPCHSLKQASSSKFYTNDCFSLHEFCFFFSLSRKQRWSFCKRKSAKVRAIDASWASFVKVEILRCIYFGLLYNVCWRCSSMSLWKVPLVRIGPPSDLALQSLLE